MANARKRILELTPLPSASLNTTIVGVDNGTTYKIELDVLADAVTSRVNILDRDRLASLESVTSSFESKGRSVISSSAQITALGFVSTSVDITSLNSFTSSQQTLNTAFTNGISARLQTASFNEFSASVHSEILAATNEQDLSEYVTQLVVNTLSGSVDGRLDNLESNSGSYLTSLNGTISGSSQLTSSYDERYVLSGSITQTTWDNIANKPSGIVSQSTDLSSLNTFTQSIDSRVGSLENTTSSYLTSLSGAISSSAQVVGILSSLNSYTSSLNNAIELTGSTVSFLGNIIVYGTQSVINSQNVEISDNILYLSPTASTDNDLGVVGHYNDGTYRHAGIFMDASDGHSWKVFNGLQTETTATVDTSGTGFTLADFKAGAFTGTSFNGQINSTNGVVSGSSQLTSSFDIRYATSASYLTSLNGAITSSEQVLGGSGVYSSSAQLPSGIVSGSSQLTASYDTRYTLSGSVVSGTTPAGTISGSSQLTSSFDGRYTQTGSFNTLTASFNSFTASGQAVTTGSNTFNGTQTITGSLNITNGSVIASQITANTASLYLTSGSNLYVQNNGVVEITGSLNISGSSNLKVGTLNVGTGSGYEGGEIDLAYAQAGSTTLTGSAIIFDVYQDKIRIFENGGTNRGVSIDLSKAPAGVGGDLLWKTSGFVNAGTDVTLGNLKARIPTSGNRSLQLSTVSGTYSIYGSAVSVFNSNLGSTTISSGAPLNVSTTPAYLNSGNTFGTAGGTDTWNIMDTTNLIGWRVSCIIGASYNSNLITIERLF